MGAVRLAQRAHEGGYWQSGDIAHRLGSELAHDFFGGWADAPERAYWHRVEKLKLLPRLHQHHALPRLDPV